ncbi:uncharacterized protein LOC109719403 isoform X3 [Ananas comosus]|uniref:Uncharacterized protein LOC109719403 isoform X3 n=1 Tax=Ananas comosus TaxID=4615 RepID=A0A6P5G8S0_ANACO|nr:uncharacterized protein LOC109719403 isoform X3 [Ananas comosus]
MVCMLGHGRMATMVRLLTIENCSDITPEEMTREKIAAQIIHKEFLEADDANLLEEEDMHVFDCRPLTDPLHLVRCNACKKPIKESQYAAHAERCRSFSSNRDSVVELDGDSGHKKPLRKGRKISQSSNGSILSSRTMRSLDHITTVNASENGHGDAPVPLATKIYHSQGNYRLRLKLGHLYRATSGIENSSNYESSNAVEDGMSAPPVFNKLPHEAQKDNFPQMKKDAYSLGVVCDSDQLTRQSSELHADLSGELTSAISLPNQVQRTNFSRLEQPVAAAPKGMTKVKYHGTAYSYSGSSVFDSVKEQLGSSRPLQYFAARRLENSYLGIFGIMPTWGREFSGWLSQPYPGTAIQV